MKSWFEQAHTAKQKGDRKASTNWKRWTPNWEQAASCYRVATTHFLKGFNLTGTDSAFYSLLDIYERSIIAHDGSNSFLDAAEAASAAAYLIKTHPERVGVDQSKQLYFYREAARLYQLHGSYVNAANMLIHASNMMATATAGTDNFFGLLSEACNLFETHSDIAFRHETVFKNAIRLCVEHGEWNHVETLLDQQIRIQIPQQWLTTDRLIICRYLVHRHIYPDEHLSIQDWMTNTQLCRTFLDWEKCPSNAIPMILYNVLPNWAIKLLRSYHKPDDSIPDFT